jgi:hypothetical protein
MVAFGKEASMSDLRSRLIRVASDLPKGDVGRRKILGLLKTARGRGDTLLIFANPKAAMKATDAWDAGEDEEDPEGRRSAPRHISYENFVNVDRRTGKYTGGAGGYANAILVGGDVPWMIDQIKKRTRLRFLLLEDVEPPDWKSDEPEYLDLSKARRM